MYEEVGALADAGVYHAPPASSRYSLYLLREGAKKGLVPELRDLALQLV